MVRSSALQKRSPRGQLTLAVTQLKRFCIFPYHYSFIHSFIHLVFLLLVACIESNSVCEHAGVHVGMCARVSAHACEGWMTSCASLCRSALYFWGRVPHWAWSFADWARLAGQGPGTFPVLTWQGCTAVPGFLRWCWQSRVRSLHLKAILYRLSHLPSPVTCRPLPAFLPLLFF